MSVFKHPNLKRYLTFSLIIVILGILQVTFFDAIKIFWLKPDLLLISAVCASLIFNPRAALSFGIFAGIYKDSLTVSYFGMNTLLFSLWVFLLLKLSRKISIEEDYLRLILIFVIALLHNIIYGLIHLYFQAPVSPGIFLRIVILGSLYTTLLFPAVFKISQIWTGQK